MKKIALVCALAAFAASASADWYDFCDWRFTPYVGLDAQGRHIDATRGFGDNLFKKDYPQGNVYAGFKFSEYFGLEAGYEWTKQMHRGSSLGSGAVNLGQPVVAVGAPLVYTSKAKFDGWHANLVGFLPIIEEGCCTELFASVGIVQLRGHFERTLISSAGTPISSQFHFRQTRTLARANLAIQTKIVDAFGIRATIGWEDTSRIRPFANTPDAVPTLQVKMKDSFIYGLGLFYTFC